MFTLLYRDQLQQCHCARDHLSHQQLPEWHREDGKSSGLGERVGLHDVHKSVPDKASVICAHTVCLCTFQIHQIYEELPKPQPDHSLQCREEHWRRAWQREQQWHQHHCHQLRHHVPVHLSGSGSHPELQETLGERPKSYISVIMFIFSRHCTLASCGFELPLCRFTDLSCCWRNTSNFRKVLQTLQLPEMNENEVWIISFCIPRWTPRYLWE